LKHIKYLMEITVLTENCFFGVNDMGLRGHDSKLFKRRFRVDLNFRLDVRNCLSLVTE